MLFPIILLTTFHYNWSLQNTFAVKTHALHLLFYTAGMVSGKTAPSAVTVNSCTGHTHSHVIACAKDIFLCQRDTICNHYRRPACRFQSIKTAEQPNGNNRKNAAVACTYIKHSQATPTASGRYKHTLRILFCCNISREMLRGRSSLSTMPLTKPRYSGIRSSQLSMMNTRRT